MLLAIDIGNSTAKFGVFENEKIITRFQISTPRNQSANEIFYLIREEIISPLSAIFISSVVPETNDAFQKLAEKHFGINPVFVEYTFDFNLKIKYNPPSALGIDRLIVAFATVEKYGKPCIVCDFGTATTIDAVNSESEFLGGIIAPGMHILTDVLFQKTSKLPKVEIKKPKSVFGNSTAESINAGIYFGYIGLVDEIVRRMINESGEKPRIIATGGFANLIAEGSETIETIDENLMLEGLRIIYEKSIQNERRNAEN